MKLAVLKLGARIAYSENNTSGGTGEALSIIKMLSLGGAEVHAYSKILKKDPPPPDGVTIHNIETDNSLNFEYYDALIVINGAVNFFGGAEDVPQILNYKLINTFMGRVHYVYCDPNLPLKQIWPSIEKKPWAKNWSRSTIEITRRDIRVISQSRNLLKVEALFNKGIEEEHNHLYTDFKHYPFEKFPMLLDKITVIDEKREVDISYGGTFRSGRREKSLAKYYFGWPEDISVEVFGKIKLENFKEKNIIDKRPPTFTGTVKYNQMLEKMSKSRCHIVIGDGHYAEMGMIAQRTYESINSGCVTFIDEAADPNKVVWGDSKIGQILYVNNVGAMATWVRSFKKNPILFYELLGEQRRYVAFNSAKYCSDFVKLLE